MVFGERGKSRSGTVLLLDFGDTCSPRYSAPGPRVKGDPGSGQGLQMEGFVRVFRDSQMC